MKFRSDNGCRRTVVGVSNRRIAGGDGITSLACIIILCLSSSMLTMSTLPVVSALTEVEVLYHVYANLNGNNWDSKWNVAGTDVCDESSYPGVKCNSAGKITEIHLKDNNLAGSISPFLYTLPHLKHVDVSKNRITNAGWDRLTPEIVGSSAIGSTIEVIELTSNLISSVEGVSKLKDSLTGLHMTYNNLKGKMPSELFQLHLLEILAISENALTGTIDKHIGNLTNLLELYCYGNKLTGTIPSEIGRLTKLQTLTVSIYCFITLRLIIKMIVLTLFTPHIFTPTHTQYVTRHTQFSENQLSGPLPSTIKNMGNLQTFSVHNNDPDTGAHTGELPKFDRHPYLNEL
jgi:hypothetical protein